MKLRTPLYVINVKTYEESTCRNASHIAKECESAALSKKASVVVCLEATDLRLSYKLKIPVFAQHVDAIEYGAHTGFTLPESVYCAGAKGTLLNHSEHKISLEVLKKSIERAKKVRLIVIACAANPAEAAIIAKLKPDFIAVEPPELIGGEVSVAEAKPDVISKTVKSAGKIPVLCGAGIKTKEDVKVALRLGAKGVLVASHIVKAMNPKKALESIIV